MGIIARVQAAVENYSSSRVGFGEAIFPEALAKTNKFIELILATPSYYCERAKENQRYAAVCGWKMAEGLTLLVTILGALALGVKTGGLGFAALAVPVYNYTSSRQSNIDLLISAERQIMRDE